MNPVKAKKHTDFGSGMPDPDVVGVGRAGGGTVVEGEDEEDEEERRKFEEQLQQWRKTEVGGFRSRKGGGREGGRGEGGRS